MDKSVYAHKKQEHSKGTIHLLLSRDAMVELGQLLISQAVSLYGFELTHISAIDITKEGKHFPQGIRFYVTDQIKSGIKVQCPSYGLHRNEEGEVI